MFRCVGGVWRVLEMYSTVSTHISNVCLMYFSRIGCVCLLNCDAQDDLVILKNFRVHHTLSLCTHLFVFFIRSCISRVEH